MRPSLASCKSCKVNDQESVLAKFVSHIIDHQKSMPRNLLVFNNGSCGICACKDDLKQLSNGMSGLDLLIASDCYIHHRTNNGLGFDIFISILIGSTVGLAGIMPTQWVLYILIR